MIAEAVLLLAVLGGTVAIVVERRRRVDGCPPRSTPVLATLILAGLFLLWLGLMVLGVGPAMRNM
jgi:hypothetical protein